MTTIKISDRLTAGTVRRTQDGYLVTDTKVARTGIQEYLGSELGRTEPIIRVYRPESAVFAADAMTSYAHRPMTNDHKGNITAANWRDHAIGQTGGEVVRDGDFVRVPLVLMDGSAIADFEGGKRELSMGYDASIEFKDGVTPDGLPYNAVITSMRMNHLAPVDRARGGEELRIGDSPAPGAGVGGHNPTGGHRMADTLKKIVVDGISIDTTEQGAQALEKLQKQVADGAATVQTLKDACAKMEAERDALKSKVLTDADIDARVQSRVELLTVARGVHDADYKGKSDSDVRKMVVAAKLGDAAIAGKSDAYIAARFDILAEDADPVRATLKDGKQRQAPGDNGQDAYQQRLADAWKTTTK